MSVLSNRGMAASLATASPRHGELGWLRLPSDRRQLRLRAVRDGLIVAGLLAAVFVLVVIPSFGRSLGYDALAYWAVDPADVYGRTLQSQYALGGFRYAPPLALAASLLHSLPWWLFLWCWLAGMAAALLYLGGRWALILLALPPVALEIEQGNVHLLMAVAIVMGFRWPWTWSFVLLTKVTPGIGLLWFAVRREWRSLAIALGFTVAVCVGSLAVAPQLWSDWLRALSVNAGQSQEFSIPPPLWVRLPLAALLVAWGARTDRPWTVGVAAMLALPLIWPHSLALALAAVPFLRHRAAARRQADPDGSRRRFITLRELLGSDAEAARLGGPSPWRALALAAGCLVVALVIAVLAGSELPFALYSMSRLIVPPGA
ncbi:MAG: hypothetical protein QOH61_688 [Chloroflexota bacterium]|nr:hypothetical protein [Chloroflexota bacterium]